MVAVTVVKGLLIGVVVGLLMGTSGSWAAPRLGDSAGPGITPAEYRRDLLTLAVKLKALERRVEAMQQECE